MSDKHILKAVGEVLNEKLSSFSSRIPIDQAPAIKVLANRSDDLASKLDKTCKAVASIGDALPAVFESLKALDSVNNDLLEISGERFSTIDKAQSNLEQRVDSITDTVASQLSNERLIKTWVPGIHREGTRVAYNLGDEFIALKDTMGEPVIGHPDWHLVSRGTRFRGLFKEDGEYSDGDLVVKDGAGWFWANGRLNLLAMRGEKGNRGEQGPQGPKGADGLSSSSIQSLIAKTLGDVDQRTVDIAAETVETLFKALMTPPDTSAVPIRFFRGDWHSSNTYDIGDTVMYAGHLYLAESPGDSKPPQHGNGLWLSLTKPSSSGVANITARQIDDLNQAAHLKDWTGTQAEYDALTTKDASTFYTITDAPAVLENNLVRTALESTSTFAQFKAALLAVL